MFNMITNMFAPTSGEIIFDGEQITGIKPYQITIKGFVEPFKISDYFLR